jgi:non-specific serine/threonine protein kinase
MAAFNDGGTLSLIQEVVIGPKGDGEELLDLLTGLIDKNMLRRIHSPGEDRFVMLETIREYALENLETSGEAESIRRRHAEAFLKLAEKLSKLRTTAEQTIGMDRLERERGNFNEALRWTLTHDPEGLYLRLTMALWLLWLMRGPLMEGRSWLDKAVTICTQAGDRIDINVFSDVLATASELARAQGDFEPAVKWKLQALAIRRLAGEDFKSAALLHDLAIMYAVRGDSELGLEFAEEAIALVRSSGNNLAISHALDAFYFVQFCRGQLDAAREAIEKSYQIYLAQGFPEAIAGVQIGITYLAIRQGRYEVAHRTLAEFLPLGKELLDNWVSAEAIYQAGCLAAAQDQGQLAARLFGAAEQIIVQEQFVIEIPGRDWFEALIANARSQVGEPLWQKGFNEGKAAIREVRSAVEVLQILEQYLGHVARPESSVKLQRPGSGFPGGLTAREVEVIRCLAHGMTDHQIAEALVISPRTVNAHLTSIYNKLGLKSRAAATRYAIEHQLA